jgi:hypothetical protein
VNESIADAADGERNRKLRQPRNHVCVTVCLTATEAQRSATLVAGSEFSTRPKWKISLETEGTCLKHVKMPPTPRR